MVDERMQAQLLVGDPASDVLEAVGRILAVQGQDPRGFRLALRPRSVAQATAADVDAALDRRELVVTWLNRGTLHLVRAEDFWPLHELTAPSRGRVLRGRLERVGISSTQADAAADLIFERVSGAPQTRGELSTALAAAGLPTAGQALVYLIGWSSVTRHVVRGPMKGREQCFVPSESWIGPRPAFDRAGALAELARRYLAGHGPATAQDLVAWTRLPLGACRSGLAALADEVRRREGGLVELHSSRGGTGTLPPPRLLGPFDPLLHGWASREWIVGAHQGLVTTNGIFRPFALVGGRAVATWRLTGDRVTLTPFETITAGALDDLERDAAGVLRYLGLPPAPMSVES